MYLFPEFPDQFHVRIFVDGWLVDDILRPIGVPERTERLAIVTIRRADRGDHDSLGIAAKRVLEQPREHTVAIRYEDVPLGGRRRVGRGTNFRER